MCILCPIFTVNPNFTLSETVVCSAKPSSLHVYIFAISFCTAQSQSLGRLIALNSRREAFLSSNRMWDRVRGISRISWNDLRNFRMHFSSSVSFHVT